MKRILPVLVTLISISFFTSCSFDSLDGLAEDGPVEEVYADLDADGFNGVVATSHNGDISFRSFGSADGPDGPAIDQHTVFDVGSLTKQFTAAGIARLEMDGELSFDDPVGLHLGELSGPLADVTLHQLLTHTSGLPGGLGDDYDPIERAEYLDLAMAEMGELGEYEYSNTGYTLLGMVIESASGVTYEQYLHDELFEPAGMHATGYVLPDWDALTVAVGYDGSDRLSAPHELPWGEEGPWWHLKANGGILSTAEDMLLWSAALQGNDILSEEVKSELFARHIDEGGGTYYGYGWASFPLPDGGWINGHNGGNGIFFADMYTLANEDLTVFLATNVSGVDEDVALRFVGRLFSEETNGDG